MLETTDLLARADTRRLAVSPTLDRSRRSQLGQFFTPAATASLMASMFSEPRDEMRLLDAGAGVGALTAAWTAQIVSRSRRPAQVALVAFEMDEGLIPELRGTLEHCCEVLREAGVKAVVELRNEDFIEYAVNALDDDLFGNTPELFTAAILNPPYKKISSDSKHRQLLRRIGIESTNLYAGFVALATSLLAPNGELVSITPRSFSNGPYFRPFREQLLRQMCLRRIHVFDRRDSAFSDDAVLQENVILSALRGVPQSPFVTVSRSGSPTSTDVTSFAMPFAQVVHANDADQFIHLIVDQAQSDVAASMRALPESLAALGVEVSTGRVIDFRARHWLRKLPASDTAPLVYPMHMSEGRVHWPKPDGRKPNAISAQAADDGLLIPKGNYVLVKRFSAKEERRRIVAVTYEEGDTPGELVGFENHLNYFHTKGRGIDLHLARGLSAYLNSTMVDVFFRQFNGHTQVNATDLRALRYPTRRTLVALGKRVYGALPMQHDLDALVALALAAREDA